MKSITNSTGLLLGNLVKKVKIKSKSKKEDSNKDVRKECIKE